MPEGHTIHRAAQDQKPLFEGTKPTIIAPDGRYTKEAKKLSGKTITKIEPVGKHLFYHFDVRSPSILHVHLALFGKLRVYKNIDKKPAPEPKGALRYRLSTKTDALDLHGCRTADLKTEDEVAAVKARLGPDPLDPKADAERVWKRISKSAAPIGTLLMNQEVVAGLGNIYRAEVLFRQQVHPLVRGKDVTREQFDAIWADSVALLKIGVKYNKIITVSREHAKEVHGKTFSRLGGRER
ncbi:MAG: DNA-formamidopyrimidine glycosylase family protein, partial [Planctomycetota bacterium]